MNKLRALLLGTLLILTVIYGCLELSPKGEPMAQYDYKVFTIPETQVYICGPDAQPQYLHEPRAGLWWTNGRENRVYVYGDVYEDGTVYPQSEQVFGHEVLNALEDKYKGQIWNYYNEDGTPKGE